MSTVKKILLDPEEYMKAVTSLNRISVPWGFVEYAAAAKAALSKAEEYNINIPDEEPPQL